MTTAKIGSIRTLRAGQSAAANDNFRDDLACVCRALSVRRCPAPVQTGFNYPTAALAREWTEQKCQSVAAYVTIYESMMIPPNVCLFKARDQAGSLLTCANKDRMARSPPYEA